MEFTDKVKSILDSNDSVETKFLNLSEQAILKSILHKKVAFSFYGGYPFAEKKRAYINKEIQNNIMCFKIIYNDKYLTLTHQNILGTLLSLSVTMDSIGDILPKQGIFFVTSEIKDFIQLEYTAINRVAIELEEYDSTDIKSEKNLEEYKISVDSMRLDLIISKITKTSRAQSTIMIDNNLVKVNHLIESKPVKKIRDSDIISIRKYGRFQILDTSNTSRKGKIIIIYGKFI